MNKRYAQISFIAGGYINQDIEITEADISAEQLVSMLDNGKAITTIQDGGDVVRVSDWKVIGTVFGTEPEMDYNEFQSEGEIEYELVQPDPKPFNASRIAIAGAVEEFIHEPEMTLDEIFEILKKAGNKPPKNLAVEHGYRDLSGTELRNEIDMFAGGLKNLMLSAYNAAKINLEFI